MTDRGATRLAWSLFTLTALLAIPHVYVVYLNREALGAGADIILSTAASVMSVGYAAVGALIASRARNVIGWLFIAVGVGLSIGGFAEDYVILSLSAHGGRLPATSSFAWMGSWTWFSAVFAISLLLLLFPTGRVPTRRWRFLPRTMVLATAGAVLASMFQPGKAFNHPVGEVRNPVGIDALRPFTEAVLPLAVAVILGGMLASIVALFLRYRRARGEERLQLKWFVSVALLALLLFGINVIDSEVFNDESILNDVLFTSWILMLVVGIPASATIALLKYRLYDIDVVINKTVVYGALAGFITLVYVGIVVGIGTALGQGDRPNLGLSILATAVVAVAFQPVRERVQRFANRLVYGKRATPYEILSDFSKRMTTTYGTEDLLPQMAKILAEAAGAARAAVWLAVGSELRPEAQWPQSNGQAVPAVEATEERFPTLPGFDLSVPVRDRGEMLGALAVAKPRGEPLTPTERKLLSDLASQAGLVLRNVKLIEELRASRQRIVSAQDEERRRIERNIHDGAQQQLVALNVKLGLAKTLAARDAEKTDEMLAQLQTETQDALENLRDLARGIYPPLLRDKGLVAALDAQTRKVPVPVEITADGMERYSQEIEAGVYFVLLEALQNVTKYARATRVNVRLSTDGGHLTFEAGDDGAGFDPATTKRGSGLTNMTDRIEALGGTLEVHSAPGSGTSVRGRVPVTALEPVS